MNRLAQTHSPYLLQHKDNPVAWQPWDETALLQAKQLNKPIFLSVGYAACHWCHVMEHESFENAGIAAILNEHFVCIKVDREERPDVDKIYMNAVQVMTGRGGWPMSVFLTPELEPYYTGTYWPTPARGGMPGFAQVLDALIHAWNNRREDVLSHATEITNTLRELAAGATADVDAPVASVDAIDAGCERLLRTADTKLGGFGAAPKFPHVTDLDLLLRSYHIDRDPKKLHVVTCSLDAMADGGIFDQVGGGFARYSVDAHWLVPHFEKMLYDNAMLAKLYVDAFQVTGNSRYADVATETLDYLLREMRDSEGGIHSSEDADSEAVEGKFYVWTPKEVIEVLGWERGNLFCEVYDITEAGNFEEKNIPRLKQSIEQFAKSENRDITALKTDLRFDSELLREHRDKRVHPGRDDKVLMGWNSLAIEALATAGAVLGIERFVEAADGVATFIWTKMRRADRRFCHTFRRGHAHLDAFQDDLADFVNAAIAVYQATGKARWVERAATAATQMINHYEDKESGGFFYTADDAELLIARQKDWHDGSVRSGNGAAAMGLLSLATLTGNRSFADAAKRTLVAGGEVIVKQFAAAAQVLAALDRYHRSDEQIVIAAPDWAAAGELRMAYYGKYRPHTTLSWVLGNSPEKGPVVTLNAGKEPIDQLATVYVCKNYQCDAPMTGDDAIAKLRQ